MRFAYHMYGVDVFFLSMFTQWRNAANGRQVWYKGGDQQDRWWPQEVEIVLTNADSQVLVLYPIMNFLNVITIKINNILLSHMLPLQIGWEATRGVGFKSGIAIDSIEITSGHCNQSLFT